MAANILFLLANKIYISLTAQGLEKTTLESIDNLVKFHKGNCSLIFEVKTTLDEKLLMKSNKFKVNPDESTINALRELLGHENVKIAG